MELCVTYFSRDISKHTAQRTHVDDANSNLARITTTERIWVESLVSSLAGKTQLAWVLGVKPVGNLFPEGVGVGLHKWRARDRLRSGKVLLRKLLMNLRIN